MQFALLQKILDSHMDGAIRIFRKYGNYTSSIHANKVFK